ncbi:MAG: SLBB domain-containing protein, partial [Candidatus Sumerlaeota bacterium]|nr:SLBB domain-containing protein [Candidatus Sumerlaeota bacterium]
MTTAGAENIDNNKDKDITLKKELLEKPGFEEMSQKEPVGAFGEKEFLRAMDFRVNQSAPVNPNYVIGPKDKIVINLWGKKSQTYYAVVDENGFVALSIEGVEIRFLVNGIAFKDLRMKVIREMSKYTTDIDPSHPDSSPILVDVTLGEIRGIQIMVVGEVKRPGQYTFNSTISSIFNILAAAGGLTNKGSLRNITVRRSGGETSKVDLYQLDVYDLLTSGTLDEKMYNLQDRDILIVPTKRRVVKVMGEVKRFGLFELKDEETLQSLMKIAGGLTPNADPAKLDIVRAMGVKEMTFISVDLTKQPTMPLEDGDEVTINAKPKTRRLNMVEIKGEGVRQAGQYEYIEGMTLGDLITKAGGFFE